MKLPMMVKMKMTESLVYVDDSPIHGKGLFAKDFISAGSVLGRVE